MDLDSVFFKMFFEVEVNEILHWNWNKKRPFNRLFLTVRIVQLFDLLSTGYGKSLISQLLISLWFRKTSQLQHKTYIDVQISPITKQKFWADWCL